MRARHGLGSHRTWGIASSHVERTGAAVPNAVHGIRETIIGQDGSDVDRMIVDVPMTVVTHI